MMMIPATYILLFTLTTTVIAFGIKNKINLHHFHYPHHNNNNNKKGGPFSYVHEERKKQALVRLMCTCRNLTGSKPGEDVDPISLEPFDEMTAEDLEKSIVRVGSGHCFHISSIYEWYRTCVMSGKEGFLHLATNPVTRQPLSDADVGTILEKMKEIYPDFEPPKLVRLRFAFDDVCPTQRGSYQRVTAQVHMADAMIYSAHVTDIPLGLLEGDVEGYPAVSTDWIVRTLRKVADHVEDVETLLLCVIGLRQRQLSPLSGGDWFTATNTKDNNKDVPKLDPTHKAVAFLENIKLLVHIMDQHKVRRTNNAPY
jgi:hypothetical protein